MSSPTPKTLMQIAANSGACWMLPYWPVKFSRPNWTESGRLEDVSIDHRADPLHSLCPREARLDFVRMTSTAYWRLAS